MGSFDPNSPRLDQIQHPGEGFASMDGVEQNPIGAR
jgi:hypothetical protein